MSARPKRLPIPQTEFGFAPDTFNLFQEIAQDGDRIARERTEAEQARQLAEKAQARHRMETKSDIAAQPLFAILTFPGIGRDGLVALWEIASWIALALGGFATYMNLTEPRFASGFLAMQDDKAAHTYIRNFGII